MICDDGIRIIKLMPPNTEWAAQFENATSEIKAILGNNCIAVHIGVSRFVFYRCINQSVEV